MIWNEECECMSRDKICEIQLPRLQATVKRVYEKVPFYRKAFDAKGVKPEDIKTLEDISKLPFTTKKDLRDNYPYGLFTVPLKEIVRVHSSSGTTGKPIVVGYTKNDLNMWTDLLARMVTQAGTTADDVVQIAFGYGLFTGGFGLHYGMERVGATVIPVSSGNTERQIMIMQDFGTTVLVSTPSYALYMAEVAQEMNVDISKLKLRLGLFGAEPWTEKMRGELEKRWNIAATDNYGLSEIMGPGVAGECQARAGMHIPEDHIIPEIIDPETEEPLGYGKQGELVFTTITKEGIPMIRYRTRDISMLSPEKCACGRTHVRMRKVTGRSDDMLIIRGVNVFPSQIESVLMEIDGVEPHYQLIVTREGYLDELEVQVEISDVPDRMRKMVELEEKIKTRITSVLGLGIKLRLVAPKAIERSTGKAKRVIDKRPKE